CLALPPPALDSDPQAHPAAHARASRGGDPGAADTASRARGAHVLPGASAARGLARAPAGARAVPAQRRASPAHGTGRGALAGGAGGMTRSLAGFALLVSALAASTVRANPVAVPSAVRRALHDASVVVLPADCGGVLTTSPELVATALHCIDRGAVLRVQTAGGAVLDAHLEAVGSAAAQAG